MKLKILSVNCLGSPIVGHKKQRFTLLTKEIMRMKPEIILIQELISKKGEDILKQGLKGYKFYGDFPTKTGGLMIASKFSGKYNFTKYNRQADWFPLSWTDKWLGKGFQNLDLKIKGKLFSVFNTHLVCNYINTESGNNILRSQLTQLGNSVKRKKEVIIVTGDFNITPNSEVYKEFIFKTGLVDPLLGLELYTNNPDAVPWIFRKFVTGFTGRIRGDYAFYSGLKKSQVDQKLVLTKPIKYGKKNYLLSDHYGILTDIFL